MLIDLTRDVMTAHTTKCEACGESVSGEVYYRGFSNMEALYCSSCPRVLLLTANTPIEHLGIACPSLQPHHPDFQFYCRHLLPYFAKIEDLFQPCECGGRYGYMNPPRCPKCNGLLRGDLYEDKPILKLNDLYAFVSVGSVDGNQQIKPEYAPKRRRPKRD